MSAVYRSPRLGLVALWLLAACSPSSSSSPSSSEPSASSLATSPQAMSLMTSLRQGFRLVPVVVPAEPGGSPSAPADPEPLLRRSEVERYEVRDGWVIPHLPDHALEGRLRPARVRLPLRASGAFEVKDDTSGLGIRVKRVGGTEAVVEQAEGWAVYRGGLRGGDVVHRVHGEGTEDYVHVATKPEVEELRYVVDVSGVAGLRRVNNVVELLDGEGYPRLRIAAPLALDARGEKLAVRLEVEGCAYDEDPAAPWEREVVSPGASECEVVARWKGGEYPLVVDPAFVSAGSLAVGRSEHTASALADGSVLVVGGEGNDATACPDGYCKTAERWVNGGFSAAGSLAVGRAWHTASALADGSVLVVGGSGNDATACPSGRCKTAERWVNGGFSAAGSLAVGRLWHTASALADGSVLVVGGYNDTDATACPNKHCKTAERWVNGGFSAAGSLAVGRSDHTASVLADGSVLVVGGYGNHATCPSGSCKTAERWVNGGFSAAGSLAVGRFYHTASALADGSVLVVGGYNDTDATACPNGLCKTAERWVNGGFSAAGSLAVERRAHTASVLADGSVLVVGGVGTDATACPSGYCKTAERWVNGGFSAAGSLAVGRSVPTASALADGSVLVVGGYNINDDTACPNGYCKTAERWDPTLPTVGMPCSAPSECPTGFCVDGVCCDKPCNGICEACRYDIKGFGANGFCEPIQANTDPQNDGGVCVELKELGSPCTDGSECAKGFCAEGVCCDSPCLDACTTCTAIGKLGTCSLVGANQSPPPGKSCPGEGPCASFCDGTSPSCSKPSAGTSCAPASCSGNVLQPAGACDNAGLCVIPNPKPCDGNFACDSASATCKTSCSSPADCAQGYTCQNATCVQDSGAGGTAGSGGSAPVAGSGGSAPVAGGGGAPTAPTAAEEGGCGCALPGRSPSTRGAWLAAALGLAAFRRRRRAA
jgi:MYXO-CTERM domain-containing protein